MLIAYNECNSLKVIKVTQREWYLLRYCEMRIFIEENGEVYEINNLFLKSVL